MALTKVSSGLISADASLVDLNIDAGTLYIDATNNRVGVKNQTPTVALDVTGDLVVSASATLGTTSVGQLTFTSLTNTTTDIPEGSKLFFTEQRVLDTAPSGSLGGTLGDVTVQYRTDGNYSGTPNQGSFYFDALNSRLKVYTGSEFIDTIPFTAGGGGGATTEANATFFKYQYTVASETNTITGADIQEISSGAYVIGKSYEISVPGTTDFTALGSADNISGTTFTATATGLVVGGDFVATEEYTIVSVDDGAGGATTDFTLIGAADNDIGTTFTATGVGAGTGFASQGSGTAHGVLGYSTSSSTDVVVFVNGVKQRESSVDGYQASTGTNIAFTYNLPVDSVVDVQVYELLKNDAYYTKAQTYTQTETNTQISTALSTYDDQTASDARYVNVTGDTMTGNLGVTGTVTADGLTVDSTTGFSWLPVSTAGAKVGAIGTGTGLIINTPSVNADFGSGLAIDGSYASDLSSVNVKAFGPKFSSYGSELNLFTSDDTSLLKRQTIASNGDVSLYEASGTTPKFFWDASAESLGIGTSDRISSPLTIQSSAAANALSIIGRDNGNSDEAVISFYEYDGTTRNIYIVKEAGELAFVTGTGGAPVEKLRLGTTSTIFNETGADQDFRVESVGNENMLFVDGGENKVGIGTGSPGYLLDVLETNIGGVADFRLRNAAASDAASGARNIIQVANGSVGDPRLVLSIEGIQEYAIGIDNSDSDILKFNNGSDPSTSTNYLSLGAGAGGVVVNDGSDVAIDFRVESVGNENMLFVDGGNNVVVVGGTTAETGDTFEVISADATTNVRIRNTNAGATGPILIFDKSSASPANDDDVGDIRFIGKDSGGNAEQYARLLVESGNITSGGEDGITTFNMMVNGTDTNMYTMNHVGTTFNEGGDADLDFRVKSVNNTHMLYVDASEDEVVVGEGGGNQANATLALNTGSNKHGKSIYSNNTITGSSEASVMAEGTFAVDTTSLGTKLTIPIFSQGSSWKKYIMEFMFSSAEYNLSGSGGGGTCTLAFTSLSVADNMVLLSSTGNVTSANVSGSNIEINFTNGFVSGTNGYEGVLVYYKILSSVPSYVQTWNATLN